MATAAVRPPISAVRLGEFAGMPHHQVRYFLQQVSNSAPERPEALLLLVGVVQALRRRGLSFAAVVDLAPAIVAATGNLAASSIAYPVTDRLKSTSDKS